MANPLWGPLNAAYFTLDPTVANADEQAWLDQNRNPQPIDPLNENKFDPNEYGLQTVKNDQTFQPDPGMTLQEMLAQRDLQSAAQPSLSQADSPLSFQYQNEEYPDPITHSRLYNRQEGMFSPKMQTQDQDAYYDNVLALQTGKTNSPMAWDDAYGPLSKPEDRYSPYVEHDVVDKPGGYAWENANFFDNPRIDETTNPMLMEALIRQKQNNLHGVPQNLGFKEESETISTPLDMERFAGVSELGRNDEDVEQVEYLGSPSKFQNFKSRIDDGLGSFRNKASQGWNLVQQLPGMAMGALSGIPGIGMLMNAIGNQFEDRQLTGDIMDESGNMYSAEALNKMNARGGYYTDPARSARRRTSRIQKMLARKAAEKNYSEKNLKDLLEQTYQQSIKNPTYSTTTQGGGGGIASSGMTGAQAAGMGGGSRQATSAGSTKSGRTDGGWGWAKGGRVRFSDGGLATLFTRRG